MEVDIVEDCMHLGNDALSGLEIFNLMSENAPNSTEYCLYGLLNKCRTAGGKALLKEWLKKPLCDLQKINQRLDIVEAFNEASECRETLHRDYLRRVHGMVPLTRKLAAGKASLDDCFKLYRCICTLDSMIEIIERELAGSDAIVELVLDPLKHSRCELDKLRSLIESTVMINELTNQACIKPDIDENLLELNDQITRLKTKADAALASVSTEVDTDTIKLDSNTETGFFFRVTLKSEKHIRAAKVKILTTTKGGGVTFTTTALEKLSDDFCDLSSQYEAGQSEIKKDVIETCGGYAPACEVLAQKLAFVDVLVSFSIISCTCANQYVRPELLEKGRDVFELVECRHPIVEYLPFAPTFIPNNVSFENECRFAVLTGPNMGGKSTYLKAAAITVILGQIGCFVPCSSARFSLVDGVFCRVGADDNISKGISTFMEEMKDVATILTNATPNSLVIVDELGRGTSTFDGFGLAYAVAEEIVCKTKCWTLFATHFHEMVQLKNSYPEKVKNLKVETYLDENGMMTILYKISEGVSEQSFGISIARMVGFSDDIVKDAEQYLGNLEKSSVDTKELMARKVFNDCQQLNADEIRSILAKIPTEQLN